VVTDAEWRDTILGDLRDPSVRAAAGVGFDLVTGTPPYFPVGSALVSPDPQRAHARVELRGGVEAYLAAARDTVREGGVVVVCADAQRPPRVTSTAEALGLACEEELRVLPREGKKALLSVWTLRRGGARTALAQHTFVARTADGARSAAQHELRAFFGLAIDERGASPPPGDLATGATA
jgi:tRNA1(Val) A37 N6-methylase TrmN6